MPLHYRSTVDDACWWLTSLRDSDQESMSHCYLHSHALNHFCSLFLCMTWVARRAGVICLTESVVSAAIYSCVLPYRNILLALPGSRGNFLQLTHWLVSARRNWKKNSEKIFAVPAGQSECALQSFPPHRLAIGCGVRI